MMAYIVPSNITISEYGARWYTYTKMAAGVCPYTEISGNILLYDVTGLYTAHIYACSMSVLVIRRFT